MRRIRVLDLRDTHEIGGPGKTILETFRAIDASRFELHLGVFLRHDESSDGPFVRAAKALGMPVHEIRGWHQYDPRMIWRVAALVRDLEIDVVHAHEVKSDVITYLASRVRRVPIVTTLHGWIGHGTSRQSLIRLDRFIVRHFDLAFAVSGQIRDELLEAGVPAARVRVVPNAIVLEQYCRTGSRGYLADLVGHSLAGPVIASIGRISPEKGHADLVEALALTSARGVRFSAVFAGDGPARPLVADRIRALGLQGCVHLVGYIDRPQRVLEEADLMVLPSHTEGLPNAALEALAMEVPVLATRVGGTPEVITDGETGRLVPPRSPQAMADAIVDFAASPGPWQEMARRGRLDVEKRFAFATRTRRVEAIYEELVCRTDR